MGEVKIDKIVVTGRLYKKLQEIIGQLPVKEIKFLSEEEVTEEILKWADAYVAFKPTENFDFQNLKWVHAMGAGVDSFLFNREWKSDVLLTRTICSFGAKISEYCLSYILAHLQHHRIFQEQQRESKWEAREPVSIKEQNIAILGTGVIAQEIAKNLSFLGVKPVGVSLSGAQKEHFYKVITFDSLRENLKDVNWMINTLPLTERTDGIISSEILSRMENACLINVGRGRTVKEKDLLEAIDKGNLQLAVLDVFQAEPLSPESELWKNSKVTITPHIAAITSPEEAANCFLDTLAAIESQTQLTNQVDIVRGY